MSIRRGILTILLAALISQGIVFAAGEPNEDEIMRRMMAEMRGESEGRPLLPRDKNIGEPNNFVTQLIDQSEEYVVGKPMKFGLTLKNISNSVKQYDYSVTFYHPLIVKNADNNEPYYKSRPGQTADSWRSIDPNEAVTLFENRNIADEFQITRPGKYTVWFRGGRNLPESNVIEFEVKPGTPDKRDYLISLLVDVLPDAKWHAETRARIRHAPAGRKEEAISIVLRHPHPGQYAGIFVTLWQTNMPAEVDENAQDTAISEYLGKNNSGYFYLEVPPEALDYWPKIKEDIVKALNLEN